jgi:hypothetical protein
VRKGFNFWSWQIGELFPNSAPRIDLHQTEARFSRQLSSDLLQIQTTQSIAWKKKGLLMKAIVHSTRSPIRRPSLRRGFLLIPLLLACFGLAPMAQAVGPDTDGNIPGSNNGEGIGVLVSRATGVWNTGTGFEALNHVTGGNQNTATGLRALFSDTNGGFNTATGVLSLFSNTSGFFNSATGAYSLANNISGNHNTANGYAALYRNTANDNTAAGFAALGSNTTGANNTAIGDSALFSNTTGSNSTAIGYNALLSNTHDGNTAVGYEALQDNTAGFSNTATGDQALLRNTTGNDNTANGLQALRQNNGGSANTAIGDLALQQNTEGFGNVAVGGIALVSNITGDSNTAVGRAALQNSTGSNNTAIGDSAGLNQTSGSGNVYIGQGIQGVAGESDACRIRSIFGQTAASGSAVFITSGNKLGTDTSSKRFKEEIKPMDKASEALLALKPVTFRYKKEIDPAGTSQFGLVAEEVERVNPDLVVRDKEGKPYSVRYDQVNAMLLNEFLKEHKTVQELKSTVAKQETIIAQQQKSFQCKLAEQEKKIEALTSGLQRVSDQLELSKPAQRTVVENR